MKVTLQEGSGFILELIPEDAKEVNMLARFAAGSRKKTARIETTFYKDGTTRGYVTSKAHQHKAFGTIK